MKMYSKRKEVRSLFPHVDWDSIDLSTLTQEFLSKQPLFHPKSISSMRYFYGNIKTFDSSLYTFLVEKYPKKDIFFFSGCLHDIIGLIFWWEMFFILDKVKRQDVFRRNAIDFRRTTDPLTIY